MVAGLAMEFMELAVILAATALNPNKETAPTPLQLMEDLIVLVL